MDAGPMVALLNRRDQHHRACVAALRRVRGRLVTVWPAVTEAMYILGEWSAQQALWERILDEAPILLPLDKGDIPRMRDLMAKYADRPMDLADAALVRVAEREGIRSVFTVDADDFRVYRPAGIGAFRVIP